MKIYIVFLLLSSQLNGLINGFTINNDYSIIKGSSSTRHSSRRNLGIDSSRTIGIVRIADYKRKNTHPQYGKYSNIRTYIKSTSSSPSPQIPDLYEQDFRYGISTPISYSPTLDLYTSLPPSPTSSTSSLQSNPNSPPARFLNLLRTSFIPDSVPPSYYEFIKYRLLQRYTAAVVNVLGTRSLLLSLGIKTQGNMGKGAVLNWVLKDCLGKIVRMVWASKMGRKFDPDAKRWRFRSSLLYSLGNFLEIITYLYPPLFLLLATSANCLKQISMLTSSSTRNALYNSFKHPSRENIGDITAKGEAQISVVDLAGMATGIGVTTCMSSSTTNVGTVLALFFILQGMEITFMYRQIRAVVFKTLNFERLWKMATRKVEGKGTITPVVEARGEKIFYPPTHLCRRAIAFGSLGRSRLSPDELSELLSVFRRERYLLVVGEDVKNIRRTRQRRRKRKRAMRRGMRGMEVRGELDEGVIENAMEDCHIVLHAEATSRDIVKGALALAWLRRDLGKTCEDGLTEECNIVEKRRTGDSLELIRNAREKADEGFKEFMDEMEGNGWEMDKFMFGRVSMRNMWPRETSEDEE